MGKRCFVQVKKVGYIFLRFFETFLGVIRYRYSVFSRTTYMMILHKLVRFFSVLEMGLLLFDLTRKDNS